MDPKEENGIKVEPKEDNVESIKPDEKDAKMEDAEVKNIKMEAADVKTEDAESQTTPTILESKIIRQIEYYFGDHNLSRDKFMQVTIKEATDGWVPLELLLTFNRLKTLTTEAEDIIKALKKSTNALLEIDNEQKRIRRDCNKPLPEKNDEETARSIYVKGFALDSTLDELLEYFSIHGETDCIIMRKAANKNKTFKGSIFVTFTTKELADAFYKKPGDKYKGADLIKEMKEAFVKRKEEQFEARKKERQDRKVAKKEKTNDADGDEKKDDEENDEGKEKFNPDDIEKGCLLKITGLSDKVSWEDIKEVFRHHAEIAYVDYSRGQPEAIIRFQEKGSAALALERATESDKDKKIKICEGEVEAFILDGEDEISFWRTFFQQKQNRTRHNHKRSHGGFGRGGGRGRGRGGRGRGGRGRGRGFDRRGGRDGDRKRAGGDSSEQPAAKHSRTESS